jgi:lysophospholipase L1-like esterase
MTAVNGGRRNRRSRSLAALFGLATALAASEIFLRLFLPQPLGLSYRAANGLTLNIPGALIRYRRAEFDNPIQINSLGLRDREISLAKPAGVFRILVLGDSFAEGKQVAFDEIFPQQVEHSLAERFPRRRWEVVNGGISGYGTGEQIKFFEMIGHALEPDLVILAFCVGNDVQNNVASAYFRLHDSRLVELPLEPPTARELWLARLREFGAAHSHVYQFLRDRYHRTASSAPEPLEESPVQIVMPADEAGWRLTEALLDRLLELVDEAGARFFLVAIPQRVQVYDDEWRASTGHRAGDATRVEPELRLIAYARRRLLPFVDPLGDLHDANAGGRTYYRIDGHLNARGHRIVADAILESLVKFGLVGETPLTSP